VLGGKVRHDGVQLYCSPQVKPQNVLVEPGIPLGSYTLRPEGVVPGSCKSILCPRNVQFSYYLRILTYIFTYLPTIYPPKGKIGKMGKMGTYPIYKK